MQVVRLRGLLLAGIAGFALGASALVFAQDSQGMRTIIPADPKAWQKNPDMPYGMKTILVYGDPKQPGPYMYRTRVPSGYKMPPHKLPGDHLVTLVKGIFWIAPGERYNPMKMRELKAGSLFVIPKGVAHYSWARTEVVLQVMGEGPVDNRVEYVNPDDDPRNQ